VAVFKNGVAIGTTAADSTGHWTLDYTGTVLSDGTYSLTATTTDLAGNVSKQSPPLNVTFDTIPPSAPTLADGSIGGNGKFTVSGTAEVGGVVSIFEGTALLGTGTVANNGTWSVTTTKLSNTVHILTAQATDTAGNMGPSSGVAIVGSTANDTLVSTAANDLMSGNGGSDTFRFNGNGNQFGKDIITDFVATGVGHELAVNNL
jgi:Bacterial Ig-like domain/Bacterial Ig domain